MKTYYPNKNFLKAVPEKDRKKWAKALRKAARDGIKQAHEKMCYGNQNGSFQCCLEVGHRAFGGTNRQKGEYYPDEHTSPFAIAMKSYNPQIARGHSASDCNDGLGLDFNQLSTLIEGKEVVVK